MNVLDKEILLVSMIFHKIISIYDFKFTKEIIQKPDALEYFISVSENPEKINEINKNFVVKNPSFRFYSKNSIEKYINEVSNPRMIIESLYKESIERILKSISFSNTNNDVIDESLEAIDKIKNMITELSNDVKINPVQSFQEKLKIMKEKIESGEFKEGLVGMPTGIYELDSITGGFLDSEYILLAGRPSMGKTSLALDIATKAAMDKKSVLIFSIEMPADQLISRIVPKVDTSLTLNNTMGGIDIEQRYNDIINASELINSLDIEIEDFHDKNKVTIIDIRRKIDQYFIEHGKYPDLVVIDYIQIISDHLNRRDENLIVGDISKTLQRLAKQMGCPLIALSQLNRGLEDRVNKRPINSDLRSSGSLEQDADKILFVYREEVYLERKMQEALQKKPDSSEIAESLRALSEQRIQSGEIIISKNRNGKIGTAHTSFLKESATYSDDAENILLEISSQNDEF